jgi:SAM-dependent methyltransferase
MLGDMRLAPFAKGLLTYIPALNDFVAPKFGGHTDSAQYCYGVWMKHLTLLRAHGLTTIPDTVAELGPGDSLGVGICALLSGANHYVGLDVMPHSNPRRNQLIFKDLVPLFRNRAPNKDKGWPGFAEYLDERQFPSHILTEDVLRESLDPERLAEIDLAVSVPSKGAAITAEYKAPWFDPTVIQESTVDLILSHSVLEHVVDLRDAYASLYQWLKPGGWMSHQIDFKSHGISKRWNGYRGCSETVWKLMFGKRLFMINRHPPSTHLKLLREAGFKLVTQQKFLRTDGIGRDELAPLWADISEEDLNCSGMYVIATK